MQQVTVPPVKNVILDLGGVLLNLDFSKTERAFIELGITDFTRHFNFLKHDPIFEKLETGEVNQHEFLQQFKVLTGSAASDQSIIEAWNAMLLDFPAERIEWLDKLSSRYRIFLYSNTNAIHYDSFQQSFLQDYPEKPFDAYFEKPYYSHVLGKRKPYPDSFTYLLNQAGLDAAETMFVDDTLPNIEGAKAAGLQVIHLTGGKTVLDLGL